MKQKPRTNYSLYSLYKATDVIKQTFLKTLAAFNDFHTVFLSVEFVSQSTKKALKEGMISVKLL